MLSMIPCCVFSAAAIEGSQPGEGVLPISNSSSRKIGLEKSKLKPMKATRDHGRHMVVDREHIGKSRERQVAQPLRMLADV